MTSVSTVTMAPPAEFTTKIEPAHMDEPQSRHRDRDRDRGRGDRGGGRGRDRYPISRDIYLKAGGCL